MDTSEHLKGVTASAVFLDRFPGLFFLRISGSAEFPDFPDSQISGISQIPRFRVFGILDPKTLILEFPQLPPRELRIPGTPGGSQNSGFLARIWRQIPGSLLQFSQLFGNFSNFLGGIRPPERPLLASAGQLAVQRLRTCACSSDSQPSQPLPEPGSWRAPGTPESVPIDHF